MFILKIDNQATPAESSAQGLGTLLGGCNVKLGRTSNIFIFYLWL